MSENKEFTVEISADIVTVATEEYAHNHHMPQSWIPETMCGAIGQHICMVWNYYHEDVDKEVGAVDNLYKVRRAIMEKPFVGSTPSEIIHNHMNSIEITVIPENDTLKVEKVIIIVK